MLPVDRAILALVLLVAASASANLATLTVRDIETPGQPVQVTTTRFSEHWGELVLHLLSLVGVGWIARALIVHPPDA